MSGISTTIMNIPRKIQYILSDKFVMGSLYFFFFRKKYEIYDLQNGEWIHHQKEYEPDPVFVSGGPPKSQPFPRNGPESADDQQIKYLFQLRNIFHDKFD